MATLNCLPLCEPLEPRRLLVSGVAGGGPFLNARTVSDATSYVEAGYLVTYSQTGDDSEMLRFDVPERATLLLTLKDLDLPGRLAVFSADEAEIASFDAPPRSISEMESADPVQGRLPVEAGTYYVRVSIRRPTGWAAEVPDASDYTLGLSLRPYRAKAPPKLPPPGVSEDRPVDLGLLSAAVQSGNLAPTSSFFYYRFAAPAGELSLSLVDLEADAVAVVRSIPPAGEVFQSVGTTKGQTGPERHLRATVKGGEYLVTVALDRSKGTTPYRLGLRLRPTAPATGRIAGTLFDDADADGLRSSHERALGGWRVFADLDGDGSAGPGEPSALTTGRGRYVLDDVPAGPQAVRVELPAGWRRTGPPFSDLPVLPGRTVYANPGAARLATSGSVAGTLFADANRDGLRSNSEPALRGQAVFADTNGNGAFDTGEPMATTDRRGRYILENLAAGPVAVRALSSPASPFASAAETVEIAAGQRVYANLAEADL